LIVVINFNKDYKLQKLHRNNFAYLTN